MEELINYTRKKKNTQGAIRKVFIFPYEKVAPFSIQNEGMILTEFPQTSVYQFDVWGNYTQDSQVENGAWFMNQNISIKLPKIYEEIDIQIFLKQDYKIIAETNNGQFILFGAYNGMEANITNASGSEKPEFNGGDVTFTGKEETTGLLIEDFSQWFNIKTPNLLNATLNFNL